jgi:hypothetical protein
MTRARRKPDNFTNPADYGDPIREAIYQLLGPLDRVATAFENKWGPDRLPTLVSVESAARFGSAKGKLDAAIVADDLTECSHRAAVLMRGWHALDAEATAAGHGPLELDVWVWRPADGADAIAVCPTPADIDRFRAKCPDVRVYTIPELCRLALKLEADAPLLGEIKREIGGTVVRVRENVREPLNEALGGDDIPANLRGDDRLDVPATVPRDTSHDY